MTIVMVCMIGLLVVSRELIYRGRGAFVVPAIVVFVSLACLLMVISGGG